jgi:glucosamine-6-phosphate deaminase
MSVYPIREMTYDQLACRVYGSNADMGRAAAEHAATVLRAAIAARGVANVVLAAANSQLTFLHALRNLPDNGRQAGIQWQAVNVFHMDEYLDLAPGHPAGFARFLRRYLVDQVDVGAFYPVPSRPADVDMACRAYELLLQAHPVDLCCLGIGENGHVAFNEPPVADFQDPVWLKRVTLDETSRQQQVGEGHYASLNEVPTHALTMTIPALCAAKTMICIVPETRKAQAVYDALLGPVSTACPASILRQMPHAVLYLDRDAAAKVP